MGAAEPGRDPGEVRLTDSRGVQIGDSNVQHNYYIGESGESSLTKQRERFFFQFFRQALRQSGAMFVLSIVFMSCGAAIILAGGVLALMNAENPNLDYIALITSLTGVLLTVGGGALAVHANRARKHLTEHAVQMEAKIDGDHKLVQAQTFIAQITDPELKDRLNAVATMRLLDMNPHPDVATDRILPGPESAKAVIEPEKPGEGRQPRA